MFRCAITALTYFCTLAGTILLVGSAANVDAEHDPLVSSIALLLSAAVAYRAASYWTRPRHVCNNPPFTLQAATRMIVVVFATSVAALSGIATQRSTAQVLFLIVAAASEETAFRVAPALLHRVAAELPARGTLFLLTSTTAFVVLHIPQSALHVIDLLSFSVAAYTLYRTTGSASVTISLHVVSNALAWTVAAGDRGLSYQIFVTLSVTASCALAVATSFLRVPIESGEISGARLSPFDRLAVYHNHR